MIAIIAAIVAVLLGAIVVTRPDSTPPDTSEREFDPGEDGEGEELNYIDEDAEGWEGDDADGEGRPPEEEYEEEEWAGEEEYTAEYDGELPADHANDEELGGDRDCSAEYDGEYVPDEAHAQDWDDGGEYAAEYDAEYPAEHGGHSAEYDGEHPPEHPSDFPRDFDPDAHPPDEYAPDIHPTDDHQDEYPSNPHPAEYPTDPHAVEYPPDDHPIHEPEYVPDDATVERAFDPEGDALAALPEDAFGESPLERAFGGGAYGDAPDAPHDADASFDLDAPLDVGEAAYSEVDHDGPQYVGVHYDAESPHVERGMDGYYEEGSAARSGITGAAGCEDGHEAHGEYDDDSHYGDESHYGDDDNYGDSHQAQGGYSDNDYERGYNDAKADYAAPIDILERDGLPVDMADIPFDVSPTFDDHAPREPSPAPFVPLPLDLSFSPTGPWDRSIGTPIDQLDSFDAPSGNLDVPVDRSLEPSLGRSPICSFDSSVDRAAGGSFNSDMGRSPHLSFNQSPQPSFNQSPHPSFNRSVGPALDRSFDSLLGRSSDGATNRSFNSPLGHSRQHPPNKSFANPLDRTINRSFDSPRGRSSNLQDRTFGSSLDRTVNRSYDSPLNRTVKRSFDSPIGRFSDRTVDRPLKRSISSPIEGKVDKCFDPRLNRSVNRSFNEAPVKKPPVSVPPPIYSTFATTLPDDKAPPTPASVPEEADAEEDPYGPIDIPFDATGLGFDVPNNVATRDIPVMGAPQAFSHPSAPQTTSRSLARDMPTDPHDDPYGPLDIPDEPLSAFSNDSDDDECDNAENDPLGPIEIASVDRALAELENSPLADCNDPPPNEPVGLSPVDRELEVPGNSHEVDDDPFGPLGSLDISYQDLERALDLNAPSPNTPLHDAPTYGAPRQLSNRPNDHLFPPVNRSIGPPPLHQPTLRTVQRPAPHPVEMAVQQPVQQPAQPTQRSIQQHAPQLDQQPAQRSLEDNVLEQLEELLGQQHPQLSPEQPTLAVQQPQRSLQQPQRPKQQPRPKSNLKVDPSYQSRQNSRKSSRVSHPALSPLPEVPSALEKLGSPFEFKPPQTQPLRVQRDKPSRSPTLEFSPAFDEAFLPLDDATRSFVSSPDPTFEPDVPVPPLDPSERSSARDSLSPISGPESPHDFSPSFDPAFLPLEEWSRQSSASPLPIRSPEALPEGLSPDDYLSPHARELARKEPPSLRIDTVPQQAPEPLPVNPDDLSMPALPDISPLDAMQKSPAPSPAPAPTSKLRQRTQPPPPLNLLNTSDMKPNKKAVEAVTKATTGQVPRGKPPRPTKPPAAARVKSHYAGPLDVRGQVPLPEELVAPLPSAVTKSPAAATPKSGRGLQNPRGGVNRSSSLPVGAENVRKAALSPGTRALGRANSRSTPVSARPTQGYGHVTITNAALGGKRVLAVAGMARYAKGNLEGFDNLGKAADDPIFLQQARVEDIRCNPGTTPGESDAGTLACLGSAAVVRHYADMHGQNNVVPVSAPKFVLFPIGGLGRNSHWAGRGRDGTALPLPIPVGCRKIVCNVMYTWESGPIGVGIDYGAWPRRPRHDEGALALDEVVYLFGMSHAPIPGESPKSKMANLQSLVDDIVDLLVVRAKHGAILPGLVKIVECPFKGSETSFIRNLKRELARHQEQLAALVGGAAWKATPDDVVQCVSFIPLDEYKRSLKEGEYEIETKP